MLVELACAATLAHAYIPGLLGKLVPNDTPRRPVVVFIVCGGSKMSFEDVARYHNMARASLTGVLSVEAPNTNATRSAYTNGFSVIL
ncbi:hypothetical protein FRC12_019144 [Ceratobasidium sp. 428]|nr:hypothetical protein FRC12_019144 [Ceratobasidium sp. 428]